jgi:hypothetical protein
MERPQLQYHDFDLTKDGNFAQSIGTSKYDSGLNTDLQAVTEHLINSHVSSRLTRRVREGSRQFDYSAEALVAETFNLQTGSWIEFAFTRQVPCVAGSQDEACVELVLRATPDPAELKRLLIAISRKMGLNSKDVLQLSSATYRRLVIDPNTLQFYASSTRGSSRWMSNRDALHFPVVENESTEVTSGPIARIQ